MVVHERLKQKILSGLVPVACACFTAYLGYHGIYGQRGVLAYMHVNQEIEAQAYALFELRKERNLLERRTRLLRAESLDPDLLDERGRALLGFAELDDVVIFDPESLIDRNK